MTGPEDARQVEINPRQVLGEVGLNPENLQGKTVIFFGPEGASLAGRISGAEVADPDLDAFFAGYGLVPETHRVDRVISVGHHYVGGDIVDEDRLDLLEAMARAVKDDGEIRIARPEVDPEDIEMVERALDSRGLEVSVEYVEREEEGSYLVIRNRK